MPESKVACPFCNKEVVLTVFGALPKHGGKFSCAGSGYTVKEASAMITYSGLAK